MKSIRETAQEVVKHAEHVAIDTSNIAHLANSTPIWRQKWFEHLPWNLNTIPKEDRLAIKMIFAATSFTYWQKPKWNIDYNGEMLDGSRGLLVAYKRAYEEGVKLTRPHDLAALSQATYNHIIRGRGSLALSQERCAHIKQIGKLVAAYGTFEQFVDSLPEDAEAQVNAITAQLSYFNDSAKYRGRMVYFHKRAQVLVSDMASDRGTSGLEKLTALADYKLPQVLREYGVLHYSVDLAKRIDAEEEILPGSAEETEIRASTIVAVDKLTEYVKRELNVNATPIEVNDTLWLLTQIKHPEWKPYHHTLTTAY